MESITKQSNTPRPFSGINWGYFFMAIDKVFLIENLGKDPERIKTPVGTSLCKFTMATTERFKNKLGGTAIQNRVAQHYCLGQIG